MDDVEREISEEAKVILREKQTELVKLIKAFVSLEENKDWVTLRELVFQRSLAAIEREIMNESIKPEISINKLYKLQGEWVWAKQYSETNRFVETLKKQLEDIKQRLK